MIQVSSLGSKTRKRSRVETYQTQLTEHCFRSVLEDPQTRDLTEG